MSKGLRFNFNGRVDNLPDGDKIYKIKLPSYVTTESARSLIASHINGYTKDIIETMTDTFWEEQYNGVDLIHVGPEKELTFFFPNKMSEEKIDYIIKELQRKFFEEWD